jgi:16S rRNA (cytosine967-C5)-methyltransferase
VASRRKRPDARALAVRVLRELQRTGGFSNRVLSEHLDRHPDLSARDRGLTTTLVYGVLRHRTRLDAHIDAHARDPGRLGTVLREILRAGAFELRELGRPPSIAISEAVKQARTLDPSGRLPSVVQAVLGGVDRHGAELDAELEAAPVLDVLDRRWSIPRWLAGRWIKTLGPERALERARVLADPPPVDLRIDIGRIDAQAAIAALERDHPSIVLTEVPDQPQALRARSGGDLFHGPLHEAGLISVQGLAAQQPARVLAPVAGERVLDACAGMGVKTLQLAELMQRCGSLVAADADADALAQLETIRHRGGLDTPQLELQAVVADLTLPVEALDRERFDAVLLDAPCTGLGNLARHPEIRWVRRFEDIAARAQLQDALLARAMPRVRSGGRIVYAVCSGEPEEGPQRVRNVAHTGGLQLTHETTWSPEYDRTEGFYVARLERA